ncbi:hypothetical protein JYU34_014619 [Plutella xylostella]|uniref:Uncharacterized protein n=1 Tax=Plutella xylostella TaxID=51655 RepID=A0ABQ7Q8U1_PLUXY|nr:hypothetical protein JYU34_014619 [Plutella xylostella]
MGGTQRLAAVAAVSHARHYYNHTQPDVVQTENPQYGVSVFFVSATLCGVLVAVCAACWPRSRPLDKPDDTAPCPRGVYTVSADARTTLHVHQVSELLLSSCFHRLCIEIAWDAAAVCGSYRLTYGFLRSTC